jgi:hypothetical protein
MRDAPSKFSTKELLEQLEKVKHVRTRNNPALPPRKRKCGDDRGPKIFSRKVLLWMLPYWKDSLLPYNLDVMHIEKNICEDIPGTLLKILGKTKDTDNARLDLQFWARPKTLIMQGWICTIWALDMICTCNRMATKL